MTALENVTDASIQCLALGVGEIGWHAFRLLGTLGLSVLVIWLVIRIIKQD